MWGGDYYFPERHSYIKHQVIKNAYYLISPIHGNIDYLRANYQAIGKHIESFIYPSNIYKDYKVPKKNGNTVNIQVGNSADPTNNHLETLEKLLPFKEQDIAIHVPLSYGNQEYAQKVIKQGQEWFGDKFKPITKLIPFEEYLKLLGSIDIAIFNHRRPQALGNTITLLGLGKTVYVHGDTPQWSFFTDKGIVVGDTKLLANLKPLDTEGNKLKIKKNFSEENLKSQLNNVFYG